MNKKGMIVNMVIILIIALVVCIVAFGFYGLMLSMVSQFQLGIQCSFGVAAKNVLKGLYTAVGVGALPLPNVRVSMTCQPPVVPLKQTGETFDDNLNNSLGVLLLSCWNIFGAGQNSLLFDENKMITCFDIIINSDHNLYYKNIAKYLNKTFFNVTSMKVVFIKPGSGGNAAFIDIATEYLQPGENIAMQVIYSDWETVVFSGGIYSFLPQLPGALKPSDPASQCYFVPAMRLAEASVANQFEGVVNTYTPPGPIDQIVPAVIGIANPIQYLTGPCNYYRTECGYLLKSMACCEDKMFICIPSST